MANRHGEQAIRLSKATIGFLVFSVCIGTKLTADMLILNDAEGLEVTEVRSALYDRFYTPPIGSFASQFNWIGEGFDWSGVGVQRATLISPSFYITSSHVDRDDPNHIHYRIGDTVRFYTTNDPGGPSVPRTIVAGWDLGNDLRLGMLDAPVPNTVAIYPIFTVEDSTDLVGRELYIFGRGDVKPEYSSSLRQRLGRNTISAVTNGFGNAEENSTYDFSFDVSIADVAGGVGGVGDGMVDIQDLQLINNGTQIDPTLLPTYFDGDIFSGDFDGVSSFAVVDDGDLNEFVEEVVRTGGITGGFGWAEAFTQSGDSGSPSFTMVNNKPALVGTHWAPGQDTFVGFEPAEIIALVDQHSGGTERPCFVSFTHKYVLGDLSLELPTSHLQEKRLEQRLLGDLNGDFVVTIDDIQVLEQEIKAYQNNTSYAYNWGFDLNDDGQIDSDDLKTLMEDGFKTTLADFVDDSRSSSDNRYPDGNVTVLGEAFVLVGNLDTLVDSYFDADLNLDGIVNVLGDSFILVGDLGKKSVLRINPDYNGDGQLNADDIDLLTTLLHPTSPAPFEDRFDLTSSTVAADGVTIIPDESLAGLADGVVDRADFLFYVNDVMGAIVGDIDFDGVVNSATEGFVIGGGLGSPGGWADGDLNFDGQITVEDGQILPSLFTEQP